MPVRIRNSQRKVKVPAGRLGAAARGALSLLGLEGAELSVLVCGESLARRLNREYRGVDAATDVLSFSMFGPCGPGGIRAACRAGDCPPAILGDVVICAGAAAAQAKKLGHPVSREMVFLLVHGILHLAGYEHEEGAPAEKRRAMERKQRELMRRLTA